MAQSGGSGAKSESGIVDVEDVGNMLHKVRVSRVSKDLKIRNKVEPREMVTPLMKKTLSKQGNIV